MWRPSAAAYVSAKSATCHATFWQDRARLAEFCAKAYDSDAIKKMRVE